VRERHYVTTAHVSQMKIWRPDIDLDDELVLADEVDNDPDIVPDDPVSVPCNEVVNVPCVQPNVETQSRPPRERRLPKYFNDYYMR